MDIKGLDPRKKGKKKQVGFRLKINLWTVVIAALILLFVLPLFFNLEDFQGLSESVDIPQVITDIKDDKVESIEVEDEKVKPHN